MKTLARLRAALGVAGLIMGLALGVAAPGLAASDPSIATAVTVRPEASGIYNGASKVLIAQDQLFQGQKITTGAQGQVEIVFADDTHMVVGPGSSLVIETFLMRNGGTASNFAVNALGGTFRFITGKSAKTAYHINTPTATIGVRGTKFDFAVDPKTAETTVMMYDGLISLCPTRGGCKEVTGTCKIGLSDQTSAQTFSSGEGNTGNAKFPYAGSQQNLSGNFKVKGATNCGGKTPEQRQPKPDKPEPDPKPPGRPDPIPDPQPK